MRKLRYWIRFITTFISRFKGLLFLGLVSGLFIFVALRVMIPLLFGANPTRIGITGRYHVEELPQFILEYSGDGLTRVDDGGNVKPALAEKWDTKDGGKTWTFYLKKGVYWHDGTEVTSETINYSFNDVQIERTDLYSIVFKLKEKFIPFPSVVSKPVFKKGLLGTGEWKVKKISLVGAYVEKIIFTKKDSNDLIFRFYPTEEHTKLAFKLGEVDKIVDIIDPKPFDEWNTADVRSDVNTNRHVSIFLNNESSVFKDNKNLRQALYYAIDKNSLGPMRAIGPISPKSWAFNPQVKTYDYDVEHAKELLKDIPDELLESIDIKLVTTPLLLDVAEKVSSDWRVIGINSSVLVSSILPSEYDAFLAIYDIPKDPDQYLIWHSTQMGTNISKFNDPRIDKLLEDGRLVIDQEERKKIYWDFQRFLLEDAPTLFLYHPMSYSITRK